jgi:predicted ATPase
MPNPPSPEANERAVDLAKLLNEPIEVLKSVDVIPLKRGFSKPQYPAGNVVPFPTSEDEIASKLANDPYLESKVSTYLEQVMDRQFRAKIIPATSWINLNTTEKATRQTVELVNDGFGVNQLVFLLAKAVNKESQVICIEEPEINLHPSIIRKLPKAFLDLTKEEEKQLVVSTHSENLIVALLAAVSKGEIEPEDIACYLVVKENGMTNFKRQSVTEEGQIEGGLRSFVEGELEDIQEFLGIQKEETR